MGIVLRACFSKSKCLMPPSFSMSQPSHHCKIQPLVRCSQWPPLDQHDLAHARTGTELVPPPCPATSISYFASCRHNAELNPTLSIQTIPSLLPRSSLWDADSTDEALLSEHEQESQLLGSSLDTGIQLFRVHRINWAFLFII